jgi:hypothetical protein
MLEVLACKPRVEHVVCLFRERGLETYDPCGLWVVVEPPKDVDPVHAMIFDILFHPLVVGTSYPLGVPRGEGTVGGRVHGPVPIIERDLHIFYVRGSEWKRVVGRVWVKYSHM